MASGSPGRSSAALETQALRALQGSIAHAEAALGKKLGLGHSELAALSHMAFEPDAMTPSVLAERLDLSASATTELLDRLERQGHVTRRRDDTDRRRVRLRTSEHARDEVRAALAPLLHELNLVAESFTSAERSVIVRFLTEAGHAHQRFADAAGNSP